MLFALAFLIFQCISADFKLESTITLSVTGKIDHMSFDDNRSLVFVSCETNGSFAVVDPMPSGAGVISHVFGVPLALGSAYSSGKRWLFEASGRNGGVYRYNASDPKNVTMIDLLFTQHGGGVADDLIWDTSSTPHMLLVGFGTDIEGSVGLIFPGDDSMSLVWSVNVGSQPNQFRYISDKLYVNVAGRGIVHIIHKLRKAIVGTWDLVEDRLCTYANYAMEVAYPDDQSGPYLIISCQHPANLLIYSLKADVPNPKPICLVPTREEVDNVHFDAGSNSLLVSAGGSVASGGEGYFQVFNYLKDKACPWAKLQELPTAAGSETSLWIPTVKKMVVGVTGADEHSPAKLLVFSEK